MKRINKLLALFIAACTLISLCACNADKTVEESTASTTQVTETETETETTVVPEVEIGITGYMDLNSSTATDIAISEYKDEYEGLYIFSISESSILKDAEGFRLGDILQYIDGTRVKTAAEVIDLLSGYHAGDSVVFGFYRYNHFSKETSSYDTTITLPARETTTAADASSTAASTAVQTTA